MHQIPIRAFGKLKDHKTPMGIRPIVNKKEGPSYCLEEYMTKIYQNFIPENNNSLRSTIEFINKIRDLKIEEKQKMNSFDIVNLYPSINIKEISELINKEIIKKYEDPEVQDTLIRTSNLIINENYFKFNNKICK